MLMYFAASAIILATRLLASSAVRSNMYVDVCEHAAREPSRAAQPQGAPLAPGALSALSLGDRPCSVCQGFAFPERHLNEDDRGTLTETVRGTARKAQAGSGHWSARPSLEALSGGHRDAAPFVHLFTQGKGIWIISGSWLLPDLGSVRRCLHVCFILHRPPLPAPGSQWRQHGPVPVSPQARETPLMSPLLWKRRCLMSCSSHTVRGSARICDPAVPAHSPRCAASPCATPERCRPPKGSPHLPAPHPGSSNLPSASLDLPVTDASYKGNHVTCALLCPMSLSIMSSSFTPCGRGQCG